VDISELEALGPFPYLYDVRDQLKTHVYSRSEAWFAAGDSARDELKTQDDVVRRQSFMRRCFVDSLGGMPSSDASLNARVVGVLKFDGLTIEKIVFEARPRVYVTANLYLPAGINKPTAAVLFPCGHAQDAKHNPGYQVVCRHLAAAGLIVLAQDPVGQGERLSYFDPGSGTTTVGWGTYEHDYAGSQCLPLGDAIGRYFLHDTMRGMDYLISRPEVDPHRIGVTGSSGGGTQSSMMMLADPRVAAAAPATFVMNRQTYMYSGGAQDAEQIWPGVTLLGLDHEDILLAMAPKPVRVLAVKYDFFPIEGTRRTVERSRRLWGLFGKEDCVDLVEDDSVHHYTPLLARAAAAFFSRHLLGAAVEVDSDRIQAIAPSDLWCTSSGQVRADYPDARFVFDENLERLREVESQRQAELSQKVGDGGLAWLREKVFADRKPCELNPRFYFAEGTNGFDVQAAIWWSQEGLFNHALMFRSASHAGKDLPVVMALWDEGTDSLQARMQWIRKTCEAGAAVMVFEPTGVGAMRPNPLNHCKPRAFYGVIHKFNDDLIWLGDSIAALRTYDVVRALDMLKCWPKILPDAVRVFAEGRYSLYPKLAALLDDRIASVECPSGDEKYSAWLRSRHYDEHGIRDAVFPGLLQHLDL